MKGEWTRGLPYTFGDTYRRGAINLYSFTPPYPEEKKATSTGHHSNHYWSLLVTSTTSRRDQYWSDRRPVLVVFTTLYIVGAPLLAIHSQAAGRYTLYIRSGSDQAEGHSMNG